MEVLMIVVASACGAIFGFLWKYFLDKDLVKDAFYEWDEIYSEERKKWKDSEKRLYAEVTRLHKENAMLKMDKVVIKPTEADADRLMKELRNAPLVVREAETEPWLDMLENVNDPDWVDVDFRKEW